MKREIKFRGRRIDNGEWVYGYLVVDPKGQCKIYWQPFQAATSNTYHIIDPETVGQYTGLKDKNGVEMFEGDILRSLHFKDGNKTNYLYHIIEWYEKYSSWYCRNKYSKRDEQGSCIIYVYMRNSEEIEVIGNIYENPELL